MAEIMNQIDCITLAQVSSLVGRHKSTVLRRKGIENYIIGTRDNTYRIGAPEILFDIKILNEFGFVPKEIEEIQMRRKQRNDRSQPRKGITPEMERTFIDRAFAEYLSQAARRDIQGACWRAAKFLYDETWAEQFPDISKMANYFYQKRIMRKDQYYTGYAHKDRWEESWERRWKQSDYALKNVPTMAYNWLEIGESLGLLGPGYGAGTIFWLDDHVGDSFVRDENRVAYKGSLPKGLYLIDGWTGMPLGYEPGEVTSASTALLILRTAMVYGLPLVIGMENSRAMKGIKVEKVIEAMYYSDMLQSYRNQEHPWYNVLFEHHRSPIVRNIPNIPRFTFKARIEAWFKNCKIHDALYFPETFQNGGLDPVQKHLNTTPVLPAHWKTEEIYFESMRCYLNNEFLERPHPGMFPGFHKKTGLTPSIQNVWSYYGGTTRPGTGKTPDQSKIASVLYWLADEKDNNILRKTIVKGKAGRVMCTIDGMPRWYVDASLNTLAGHNIAIVTIPSQLRINNDTGRYAALFLADNKENPRFLNICRDLYTTDAADIEYNRTVVRDTRKALARGLDEKISEHQTTITEIEKQRQDKIRHAAADPGGDPSANMLQLSQSTSLPVSPAHDPYLERLISI
jgi:hypothetical protein